MIKPYTSQQPVDDFGLMFPDLKYSATLAAATPEALVIPGAAQRYKALIKCGFSTGGDAAVVWVAYQPNPNVSVVPAVPAGATFAATTSEAVTQFYPLCREVRSGDILNFVTAGADVDVSVVLYGYNTNN